MTVGRGYWVTVRPLLFANWSLINARFTALMWTLAVILALVVLAHVRAVGPGARTRRGDPRRTLTRSSDTRADLPGRDDASGFPSAGGSGAGIG